MARWTGYLLSRPSRIRPSYSPSGNRGSRNMTWPRCFPGPRPRFLAFFPSAVYVQDSAPRGAKEQAPFPGSEFPASRATTPPVQRPWAPKSRSHEGAVRRRKLAQMPSRPPRLAGLVADPPRFSEPCIACGGRRWPGGIRRHWSLRRPRARRAPSSAQVAAEGGNMSGYTEA